MGELWKRICQLLGITRRLLTAHHPETDGATERENADIEAFLRMYLNHHQNNWNAILPCCEQASNNRISSSTGSTPFYLTHGYDLEPIQLSESVVNRPAKSRIARGEQIVKKLKDAQDLAVTMLANAQDLHERYANAHRTPAPDHQPGDVVWLDLRHIRSDRPSRKLDVQHAKFTVLEKVGSHAYRLNTPPGIHDVFHTRLLRPATEDPLPSQVITEWQPKQLKSIDETPFSDKWRIERIIDEKIKNRGRGVRHFYLVKWSGYRKATWEPATSLADTQENEKRRTLRVCLPARNSPTGAEGA